MKYFYPFSTLLFVVTWLVNTNPAMAFSSLGHARIEKRACLILQERAVAATSKHLVYPDPRSIINELYDTTNWQLGNKPPMPRTTFPDISGERQFAQDLQAYHFMTSNKAVMEAATQPAMTPAEMQRTLLSLSLPKCLALMSFLYNETVNRSLVGAGQSGRGTFVLLHIIADSYSSEHATRVPGTWDLVTIKGWVLSRLSWPCPAMAPEPNASEAGLTMLHRGIGKAEGDEEWRGCLDGLSERAEQAAQATADMMGKIYLARHDVGKTITESSWEEFVKKYFLPLNSRIGTAADNQQGLFVLAAPHPYNTIRFDFRSYKEDAFNFDYHESFAAMVVGQLAFPDGKAQAGWGGELSYHWAPGAADQSHTLIKRIEWGFTLQVTSVSITELPEKGRQKFAQYNLFAAPNITTLPILNAVLQPRLGLGCVPGAEDKRWGWAFGGDFIWNFASDLDNARVPGRIAVGYEFDHASLPARNSIVLKVGVNNWHTRQPYK